MSLVVASTAEDKGEYRFRHCVVASTWAFEAQGPGSIPGGGATKCSADRDGGATKCSADRDGGAISRTAHEQVDLPHEP